MKEDLIAKYAQQVLLILGEKQAVAEQIAQLDKLSEALGLTDYDLAYLDTQFEDAQKRGAGYLQYKQWQKAITELEQAILLKPLHTKGLHKVAEAYAGQYNQTKQEADRQNALYYATRCLQTAPEHTQAMRLISALQSSRLLWKSWFYRHWIWWIAMAFLLLCSVILWLSLPPQEARIKEAYTIAQQQEISLKLGDRLIGIGVQFDKEASFVRREGDMLTYRLRGYLHCPEKEITHWEARLELVDTQNKVLQSQAITLLDAEDFELRPTDNLPLHAVLQVHNLTANIAFARLRVVKLEEALPALPYEKEKVLALKNESYTANLGLYITERYQTVKPTADMFTHTLCLAYQHKHTHPLRVWRIEIQWIDKQDRLIHAETVSLLNADEPLLKANKCRNKTFHFKIPLQQKDFSRFQILVLSAE